MKNYFNKRVTNNGSYFLYFGLLKSREEEILLSLTRSKFSCALFRFILAYLIEDTGFDAFGSEILVLPRTREEIKFLDYLACRMKGIFLVLVMELAYRIIWNMWLQETSVTKRLQNLQRTFLDIGNTEVNVNCPKANYTSVQFFQCLIGRYRDLSPANFHVELGFFAILDPATSWSKITAMECHSCRLSKKCYTIRKIDFLIPRAIRIAIALIYWPQN